MSARAAWRWCVVAGLLTLLASTGFGWIAGLKACGPGNGVGPIMAFELARSPADIAALFGSEPCRSVLAAAQYKATLLDGLGFIPAYAAFLMLAAFAISCGGSDRRLALLALVAFGIAALFDEIEGLLLLAILRDLPGTTALTDPLFWIVHGKFALLGSGVMLLGIVLLARQWIGKLFALPVIAGSMASLWALFSSGPSPWLTKGHSIAWAAILVLAIISSVWPRAASSPAP